MAKFLQVVSGVYLAFVWIVVVAAVVGPPNQALAGVGGLPMMILIAISLSIPAAVLFAFGQIVGDVREIRDYARDSRAHLRAMRAYYEPERKGN